jgi:sterol desaturase/sphingolipid hydroxylase (fatty acid hydroxylase superfamily)
VSTALEFELAFRAALAGARPGSALAALAAAAGSLSLLAAVFVPLERALPARSQSSLRPGWRLDLAFFAGQYLLWSGLVVAGLLLVQRTLAPCLELGVGQELRSLAVALPGGMLAIVAVIAGDLLVYWCHRACHHFDWLWRFHRVHHSSEHLDWLAAHREHPLDGLLTQLCQNLPGILLGLDFSSLAALVVLRSAWGIFIHSNVRLELGPLALLLGSPELHHWHHARVERTRHNFANLAPWLDVLFGTYFRPAAQGSPEDHPLGLPGPTPESYLGYLFWPFSRGPRARRGAPSNFRKVETNGAS